MSIARARISEEWASYLSEVIPTSASKVQRDECHLAFFSGAVACYRIIMDNLGEGKDEEIGMRTLWDLHTEFEAFAKRFRRL